MRKIIPASLTGKRPAPAPVARKSAPAAPAPRPVARAPVSAPPAPLKRAPAPAPRKAVAPAPVTASKLSAYVSNPSRERQLAKTTPGQYLLRAPVRKVVEMSAHVYDDLSFDKAREVIEQFGDMLTELENEPWVALNGSKERLDVTNADGIQCIGFWFNVFNRNPDEPFVTSVSQVGRKLSHSGDAQGLLCERRIERQLD